MCCVCGFSNKGKKWAIDRSSCSFMNDTLPLFLPFPLDIVHSSVQRIAHKAQTTLEVGGSSMRGGLGRLGLLRLSSSSSFRSPSSLPHSRPAFSSAASASSSLPIIDLAPLVDPNASEKHKLQCAEALHHVRPWEMAGGRERGRERGGRRVRWTSLLCIYSTDFEGV